MDTGAWWAQSMELQRVGCDLACMHLSFLNWEGFVILLTSKTTMATLTQYGGFRHFHIFVSSVCRMKNSPAQRLRAEPTVKLMGETWSTRQGLSTLETSSRKEPPPSNAHHPHLWPHLPLYLALSKVACKFRWLPSCGMVQISKEGELTVGWGWDRQDKETAIKLLLRAWQVIIESAKLQWLGIAKEKLKEVSSNSSSGEGEKFN